MAVLTEGAHTGEYLVSEANGIRSRDSEILTNGQDLVSGTLVGKVTTGGKLVRYDPDATTGEESVYGILYDNVFADGADKSCVVSVRDSEIAGAKLTYSDGADAAAIAVADAELKALGLIVR